ncbi:MAG: YggT family protein [Spirochaetes bacterium]|nr:YggT family protein [Spirochaetota bacterium]
MNIAGAVIIPVLSALIWILKIYSWILIASIILSWINADPYNPIVRFIYSLTEPVLGWVRYKIPLRIGMIDLSPILVFIAIEIVRNILFQIMMRFYY